MIKNEIDDGSGAFSQVDPCRYTEYSREAVALPPTVKKSLPAWANGHLTGSHHTGLTPTCSPSTSLYKNPPESMRSA